VIRDNLRIIYFVSVLSLSGCAGCPYSFTGGSTLPPDLKTIAIPIFDDQSNFGEPALRETLTKSLTDKFVNDNTLTLEGRTAADCVLQGVITQVTDKPSVVGQGEQVSKRRIEITVKVTFEDLKKRKKIWEKPFSNWGDYESSGASFTMRQEGIKVAIDKLTQDILIETVSGW
jgi:outer membrane lipopolysaccharide assembly protein LptE/RlpB